MQWAQMGAGEAEPPGPPHFNDCSGVSDPRRAWLANSEICSFLDVKSNRTHYAARDRRDGHQLALSVTGICTPARVFSRLINVLGPSFPGYAFSIDSLLNRPHCI